MKRRGYTAAYEQLATALREERLRAGLTQAALATRLGKPQSFVAKYEAGERQLDVVEYLLVTRAIGIVGATLLRQLEEQAGLNSPSAGLDPVASSTSPSRPRRSSRAPRQLPDQSEKRARRTHAK
jgi:transcriptional regulator with XRE-family HTH domain